jgi:hypothetical protein
MNCVCSSSINHLIRLYKAWRPRAFHSTLSPRPHRSGLPASAHHRLGSCCAHAVVVVPAVASDSAANDLQIMKMTRLILINNFGQIYMQTSKTLSSNQL